eukprot:1814661-Pleurochrysis_carterae.AAC.1
MRARVRAPAGMHAFVRVGASIGVCALALVQGSALAPVVVAAAWRLRLRLPLEHRRRVRKRVR